MPKLVVGSTEEVVRRNIRILMAKGMLLKRAQGVAMQAAATSKIQRSKKGGAMAQAIARVGGVK